MSREFARLVEAAGGLQQRLGEGNLDPLGLRVLPPDELQHELAALSFRCAPSVLPVLTDPQTILGVHLRPGRSLEDSPWVSAARDAQEYDMLASDLSRLPRALLLWAKEGPMMRGEREPFLAAVRGMVDSIGGAAPIEKAHEAVLEIDYVQRWSPGYEPSEAAWKTIDCGLSYLGIPWPDGTDEPEDCLPAWEAALARRPEPEPELLALAVGSRLLAGADAVLADVLAVFRAETWRGMDLGSSGWWRHGGEGLPPWDAVLANLPPGFLAGTPFEPLESHRRTYSGRDPAGLVALRAIGDAMAADGDADGALTQLRNACHAGVFAAGESGPTGLRDRLADVCASLESDGLSEAIARETERAVRSGAL